MINMALKNLEKYYIAENGDHGAASAVQSSEVDLNLPRGYVAQIDEVSFEITNLGSNFADTDNFDLDCILLKDPDDDATYLPETNATEHDVIAHAELIVLSTAATNLYVDKFRTFKMTNIVYTARNMRFNSRGSGADADDYGARCHIKYHLVKVTDKELLALAGIL